MFADDLIVFSATDAKTVQYLVDAFGKFFKSIGLVANKAKSQIAMGGCKENHRQQILNLTKYQEVALPFRYKGVPITANK